MNEPDCPETDDLQARIRAFVVEMGGRPTDPALAAFRARLESDGLATSDEQIGGLLELALQRFLEAPAALYVCAGRPCKKRLHVDLDDPLFDEDLRGGDFTIETTACQGPCKVAPVATLRVRERCQTFAELGGACEWKALLEYASRAAAAETLLVDPGATVSHRYDPVHDHEPTSAHLRKLAFLIGRFDGEGSFAGRHDGRGGYFKEVIGAWEAGGRFISLRMAATYPLADGRKDVHEALVVVGYDADRASYSARAYTDGASVRDYEIAQAGDSWVFEDRVPGHDVRATSARKSIRPEPSGFVEILEIETAPGVFELYSEVRMVRAR